MILYRSARESGTNAPVAQLDRVTDYESVGQGFESLPAYQKNRYPIRDDGFSYMSGGTRKDGRAKRGKKVSEGESFDFGTHPVRMWTEIKPESRFQVGYLRVSDLFCFYRSPTVYQSSQIDRKFLPPGGHPRVASLALRTIHLQVARPSASEEKAGRKRNAGGNPKVCTS